ncbi:MAG: dephospho-CoA kinase [Gammaproteobacteria bacterium]
MAAKIGLTGGIGSGKSAVAGCFAELGVRVIDADAIGRELTAPGGAQFARVVACFGAGIVGADGAIDRKKLGALIFASAARRKQLEAILHPPIRAEMHARAARAAGAYCVLDIPLLVESGQYRDMQRVAVVSCARAVRIARLRSARGMRDADIKRVMRSQASERARLAVADDVIDNNGARAEIARRVRELHAVYAGLFGGG